MISKETKYETDSIELEQATFGTGCFWCVEAIFQDLKGVVKVESGYTGGEIEFPTYEQVCSGNTGHAEVIQITFNPDVISFGILVDIFWHIHNPTTINQQGANIGTQYRSVIFYHNNNQKEIAEKLMQKIEKTNLWSSPIVTEISPLLNFYKAEEYHQNYFNLNSNKPYCSMVISPKLKKFRKDFKHLLKK